MLVEQRRAIVKMQPILAVRELATCSIQRAANFTIAYVALSEIPNSHSTPVLVEQRRAIVKISPSPVVRYG